MPNLVLMAVVVLLGVSALLVLRGSPGQALRLWVSLGQVALGVSLVPWLLLAVILQILLGPEASPRTHVSLSLIWGYGPVALACLAASWLLWSRQREGLAVAAAVLVPAVYVLLTAAVCAG